MRAFVLAGIVLVIAQPAAAHPAPFSYLDLRLSALGADGSLVLHDLDVVHDLGISPPESIQDPAVAERYRAQLTRLIDTRLSIVIAGAPTTLRWQTIETLPDRQSIRLTFRLADSPPAALAIRAILFPYDPTHQTFVNVYEDDALRHQAILSEARPAMDHYAGSWQGKAAVLGVFIPAGIEHIVAGFDHVLFLIGLILLGGAFRQLATIVTAFTVGHSITLSLAALDVVSPPASIIEPAIALSIIFVGADNLLVYREQHRRPRDIRPVVAGAFGLVHGFGFATVLKEFGLPATALGWSLLSFNLGVEIGQLVIVLMAAWVLGRVRARNARLGHQVVIGGSAAVIAAGLYWFVQRVF